MNQKATSDKEQIIQKIRQRVDNGYDLLEKHQVTEACDMWWKVWVDIQKWFLPHNQPTSIQSFSDQITSDYTIYNWIQDFEAKLENAGKIDRRFYEIRYVLAFEFRKFFPKSDSYILMNMGTAAAQSLFHLDRTDEGEKLFKKLIVGDYEENLRGWIYTYWGDIYADGTRAMSADKKKAKTLYTKALAIIDESERSAVEDRLTALESN